MPSSYCRRSFKVVPNPKTLPPNHIISCPLSIHHPCLPRLPLLSSPERRAYPWYFIHLISIHAMRVHNQSLSLLSSSIIKSTVKYSPLHQSSSTPFKASARLSPFCSTSLPASISAVGSTTSGVNAPSLLVLSPSLSVSGGVSTPLVTSVRLT